MASKNFPIHFHFLVPRFFFPQRIEAKKFIASMLKKYSKTPENINYIFCSDDYLLSINKKYLKHDYSTDIITFDLGEKDRIVADIYISADRARENAKHFKVSFHSEIVRLLIHGALHLSGFNDKTSKDYQRMKKLEMTYLKQYFVSRET
jgi:probable rRNA maturation factor